VSTTQYSPQLRPLSVGEVLDASFKIVRQSFGTLAGCVLVVALPLNIINTLITASTSDNAFNLDGTGATTGSDLSTGTELAGFLLTTTLALVLTTLAAAACFRAVSGVYLGEQPTVGGSLSFAAGRVLPVIVLSFLYFFGLIPAFIAVIIPGIWLAVAWSVSFPALLSEGIGPVAAFGRSFRLVRGRWWPTFGTLLVMYLLVVVISGILGALFGATLIAAVDSEAVAAVFYTIINTLSSLITLPLMASVLTVVYFDLRVRKEGFDLQLLARGVGQDASAYDTSPQAVGAASGLGSGGGFAPPTHPPQGSGFAAPAPPAPAQSGGFAPPQAPGWAPPGSASEGSTPQEDDSKGYAPPASSGDLQHGDPLAAPAERREGDGGAES
jgi:hypothetical protein